MSHWKHAVLDNFDQSAQHYGLHNVVQRDTAKRLLEFAPDKAARILEIGCGDGTLTALLRARYPHSDIIASDISPQMVKQAREVVGDVDYIVMDGEAPAVEGPFDLIIANMTAQWFEDIEAAYEAWRHLVNKDGMILSSRPGPNSFIEWRKALQSCGFDSGLLPFESTDYMIAEESFATPYSSTLDFLRSMRETGALTPRAGYAPLSAGALRQACHVCDRECAGTISWQIIFERAFA